MYTHPQRGGVAGKVGGGEERRSGSRIYWEGGVRDRNQLKGKERLVILRLLFLEEGDERFTALSFSRLSDLAGSIRRVKKNKHKHYDKK